jgi:hypothetical protein
MHRDHAPDGMGLTLSIGRRWRVRPPLQRSRVIWLAMRPSSTMASSSLHFTVANDRRMLQSEDEK